MGFFDFLKPKPSPLNDTFAHMSANFFPKGEKDINAVTNAVLNILNNKISREEAKNIAVKSVVISRISKDFNKERLKQHLASYCLQHFNDVQIETFYLLLGVLAVKAMEGLTPSELIRQGDDWVTQKK